MARCANRVCRTALLATALALASACSTDDPVALAEPELARISFAGQVLHPELALTRETRFRGLSGRPSISRDGGMLFAWPGAQPVSMVMRDCPAPIDVAFLDETGRVVAMHAMTPEPPRRPGERNFAYESRLPGYGSIEPAVFALETAGGRLVELGVAVGDRLVFDARALAARAR